MNRQKVVNCENGHVFQFQINDDTAAATTPYPRQRGTEATRRIIHTLRKPTTTPTKVALDLELELRQNLLKVFIIVWD